MAATVVPKTLLHAPAVLEVQLEHLQQENRAPNLRWHVRTDKGCLAQDRKYIRWDEGVYPAAAESD
uniref:Uncharacterized protein n=1 Tax=Lotus japonicus TaxID=34305 RepID=I3T316_LOTJA|nr:unknown [Lotus japonicus]